MNLKLVPTLAISILIGSTNLNLYAKEMGNETTTPDNRPYSIAITPCDSRYDWQDFLDYQKTINSHIQNFRRFIEKTDPFLAYRLNTNSQRMRICETS